MVVPTCALGLPKGAVSLVQGEKSRLKLIHIEGLSSNEVKTQLVVSTS